MADYVTPSELAAQLGRRDLADLRLATVCEAASDSLDDALGRVDRFPDPVPAAVRDIALSLAVDWWKQPDATFGIVGMNETGPVRIGRDLIARYWPQLIPYVEPAGWGIA